MIGLSNTEDEIMSRYCENCREWFKDYIDFSKHTDKNTFCREIWLEEWTR